MEGIELIEFIEQKKPELILPMGTQKLKLLTEQLPMRIAWR